MAIPIVALESGGVAVGLRELPAGEILNWDGPAALVNAGIQLTLAYESALTNKTEFEVDASGDLTITPSGDKVAFAGDVEISNTYGLRVGHSAWVSVANVSSSAGAVTLTEFQMMGTAQADSEMVIGRFNASAAAPSLLFLKSRHGTIGGNTILLDDDYLGQIAFAAADGVDFGTISARITARVDDASPVAHSIGGQLIFEVAQGVGANDITEAMRLNADLSAVFAGTVGAAVFDGPIGTGAATPAAGSFTDLTFQPVGASQAYGFRDFAGGAGIALDGLTSGQPVNFGIFSADGDGTDSVKVIWYGLGTSASASTRHRLLIGWDAGDSQYQIESEQNSDTLHPISIFTEGNANQLLLAIDGSVSTSGPFTSTGDFDVNAKFNVTASTGALQMDGNLIVSGTGPHAIGTTPDGHWGLIIGGPFTSDGGDTKAAGVIFLMQLTGAEGDTTYLTRANFGGNITTQTAAETIVDVASVRISEPAIIKNVTTITNASTLLLTGAPTEGASNWALRSVSGAWYNGGTLQNVGAITGDSTLQWGSGATIASSNKVRPDYADISFDENADAMTIDYQNVWHLIKDWDTDGEGTVSSADQANNQIVFGDNRVYGVGLLTAADVAGAPATFTFDAFAISQTTVVITDIPKANPTVVETAAAHGLIAGDFVKLTDCTTMTEPNDKVWLVGTVADTTHFEIHNDADANVDSTGWGVYDASSGNMAEAFRIHCHTDNRYTNGELSSKASPMIPFSATSGDAAELYAANETNSGDVTLENGHLLVSGM